MSRRSNTNNVLGLLAFFALIVRAVAFIVAYFNKSVGILSFIADIILSGTVLLVAWSYVKTCDKVWRVVYYIILILVIVGLVFGGINIL